MNVKLRVLFLLAATIFSAISAYAGTCETFAFSMKNSMIQATLRQRCLETGVGEDRHTFPSHVVVFSSPLDHHQIRTEISSIEGSLEFPSVTFDDLENAWDRRHRFAELNAPHGKTVFDARDRKLIARTLGPLMLEAVRTKDPLVRRERLKSIRRIWVWGSVR